MDDLETTGLHSKVETNESCLSDSPYLHVNVLISSEVELGGLSGNLIF